MLVEVFYINKNLTPVEITPAINSLRCNILGSVISGLNG